jgi:starvation-inducible DNA-binding protein
MRHDRNDGHNSKLQILIQPNIGLESDVRLAIVDILNIMLADETILTTKTRGAYWNNRGANYFSLRTLFETQSKLLDNISDEMAERVRILGGIAISSLEEVFGLTRLEEQPSLVSDILHLLADQETVIRFLREDAKKCSEEYEDEGTSILLVEVMRLHEKMAWMLRSSIENEPIQTDGQKRILSNE